VPMLAEQLLGSGHKVACWNPHIETEDEPEPPEDDSEANA